MQPTTISQDSKQVTDLGTGLGVCPRLDNIGVTRLTANQAIGLAVCSARLGIRTKSAAGKPFNLNNRKKSAYLRASILRALHFTHLGKAGPVLDAPLYCQRPANWGPRPANVTLFANQAKTSAYFKGVYSCGNVWACPHCNPRIQEGRAGEIRKAMQANYNAGGICLLVTYTLPHSETDKLAYLLASLSRAHRRMKSGRPYGNLKGQYGIIGSIRSIEITYGRNGWHPHYHELLFLRTGASKQTIEGLDATLRRQWFNALKYTGITVTDSVMQIGLDCRQIDTSDYIAKDSAEKGQWGADKELTKGRNKKSGNLTAWQILDKSPNSAKYEALYREYYATTKGLRLLIWSRGLKARYGLVEALDNEIALQPGGYVPVVEIPMAVYVSHYIAGTLPDLIDMYLYGAIDFDI